jgi:tRNA(Ile)-lysidine synthase
MIKLTAKFNKGCGIAFSGGIDSLAAAIFAKNGRRDPILLHFNHGCQYSNKIEEGCRELAEALKLPIIVGKISSQEKSSNQSLEDYWRKERYKFLFSTNVNEIITAHHLDDAVETWVWSSLHGQSKLIQPVQKTTNGKFLIRPFLCTKKEELHNIVKHANLCPVDDPYNREDHLMRNYMRANMKPHIYYINPGIDTVIRKKYNSLIINNTNG